MYGEVLEICCNLNLDFLIVKRVDWRSDWRSDVVSHLPTRYPWGDEAFDKAKQENKPIFLSG